MLEIGMLDLGLLMGEGELAAEMVTLLVATPKISEFVKRSPKQAIGLKKRLNLWGQQLNQEIRSTPIPAALEREYRLYQCYRQLPLAQLIGEINELQQGLEKDSPFLVQARELIRQLLMSPNESRRQLLFEKWRMSLVSAVLQLQQQIAEAQREKQRQLIEDQLLANRTLADALDPHASSAGGLWDLAQGRWHRRSLAQVKQYAAMLQREPLLLEIAVALGRSQRSSQQQEQPAPPVTIKELAEISSDDVPDDLVGIVQGNDLMRLLPSEMAMLALPELEQEFYRRYVERQLLSYQSKGTLPRQRLIVRPSSQGHNRPSKRGPFIACIDTSGSMGGYPEECAKALFLALMRIAMDEQRACYLMLFSTQVTTLAIRAQTGLEQAERFLSMSFRGGTDLVPCLDKALATLAEPEFAQADVLVVSDFIAQNLPHSLLAKMNAQRARQTRFHAVAMSRHAKGALLRVFDEHWLLDCSVRGRLLRRWFKHK